MSFSINPASAVPLYIQVKEGILNEISQKYEIGTRIPSEAAFVKRFNVNRGTVRRAIEMLANDGVLKKERPRGTFLAKAPNDHLDLDQTTVNIAILFRALDQGIQSNFFYGEVLDGLFREGGDKVNFTCMPILEKNFNPELLNKRLNDAHMNGILVLSSFLTSTVRSICNLGMPMLLGDADIPELPVSSVSTNNIEGAMTATNFLIENGHKHIAMIAGPEYDTSSRDRLKGYRLGLLENEINFDESLVERADFMTSESGYKACESLFQQNLDFSAIFCVNDAVAFGVYNFLNKSKIKIPETISIIGFDDISEAALQAPPLTTMRIEKRALGSSIAKQIIEKSISYHVPQIRVKISPKLQIRESVIYKEC